MKSFRVGAVAVLAALLLSACGGTSEPPKAKASAAPSAIVTPSASEVSAAPNGPTRPYESTDVVQSVTVGVGDKWTGNTPVLPGAQRGIGYETTGCPSPLVVMTVFGANDKPVNIPVPMGETKGYVPLVGLGTLSGGNAYSMSIKASVPCTLKIDFVSKAGTEKQVIAYASNLQAGSMALGLPSTLPTEWTLEWSVRCTSAGSSFMVSPAGRNIPLVKLSPPTTDRYYGTLQRGGTTASPTALDVKADGCTWYLIVLL
jgi:hypothetical protein